MPYALCANGVHDPEPIGFKDIAFLNTCNGTTEAPSDSALVQKYLDRGVISPADAHAKLKPWQTYRCFSNRCFNAVSFALTLRCNFNCRHCFNAKDENHNAAHFTKEECLSLLDEMVECGIGTIRFTGGEPFVHKDFVDLVLEAHRRGLLVSEILTNGSLLTQEALDAFRAEPAAESVLGRVKRIDPLIMVSFDGVGVHDWLRGVEGAEQQAINAIKLAIANGFKVSVHLCLHKGNIESLRETAKLLSDLGVNVIRIIWIAPAPRWVRTSPGQGLEPHEFFEELLPFFAWYRETGLSPMLELWSILRYFPMRGGEVEWLPEHTCRGQLEKRALCPSAMGYVHIAADRNVFPCNAMSGVLRSFGDEAPHVIEEPLRDILSSSSYFDRISLTFEDLQKAGGECFTCDHFEDCQAGCRAIGYGTTGNYFAPDYFACTLHKQGYFERFRKIAE